jgi:hypothetical protein
MCAVRIGVQYHSPKIGFDQGIRGAPAGAAIAPAAPRHALIAQLQTECDAMARYALRHGMAIAPELVAQLSPLLAIDPESASASTNGAEGIGNGAASSAQTPLCHALATIHRRLAIAISPATPQAVALLDNERRRQRFSWLGPVPLIRTLTVCALSFLFAVIAMSLPPEVSAANIDRGFLDSSGMPLLLNALFLLSCAGLGASFATLFQAHRFVANATYDPQYDASYGARLILGIIAGLILVEILPSHLYDSGSMRSFGKPALAMLGGFSATAVHRLLHRLVETLETLVRGDPRPAAEAAFETRRAQAATERVQWKGELAAELLELQQSIEGGMPVDAVKQRLASFTRNVLHPDAPKPAASAAAESSQKG